MSYQQLVAVVCVSLCGLVMMWRLTSLVQERTPHVHITSRMIIGKKSILADLPVIKRTNYEKQNDSYWEKDTYDDYYYRDNGDDDDDDYDDDLSWLDPEKVREEEYSSDYYKLDNDESYSERPENVEYYDSQDDVPVHPTSTGPDTWLDKLWTSTKDEYEVEDESDFDEMDENEDDYWEYKNSDSGKVDRNDWPEYRLDEIDENTDDNWEYETTASVDREDDEDTYWEYQETGSEDSEQTNDIYWNESTNDEPYLWKRMEEKSRIVGEDINNLESRQRTANPNQNEDLYKTRGYVKSDMDLLPESQRQDWDAPNENKIVSRWGFRPESGGNVEINVAKSLSVPETLRKDVQQEPVNSDQSPQETVEVSEGQAYINNIRPDWVNNGLKNQALTDAENEENIRTNIKIQPDWMPFEEGKPAETGAQNEAQQLDSFQDIEDPPHEEWLKGMSWQELKERLENHVKNRLDNNLQDTSSNDVSLNDTQQTSVDVSNTTNNELNIVDRDPGNNNLNNHVSRVFAPPNNTENNKLKVALNGLESNATLLSKGNLGARVSNTTGDEGSVKKNVFRFFKNITSVIDESTKLSDSGPIKDNSLAGHIASLLKNPSKNTELHGHIGNLLQKQAKDLPAPVRLANNTILNQ